MTLPHAQRMVVCSYLGWIPSFISFTSFLSVKGHSSPGQSLIARISYHKVSENASTFFDFFKKSKNRGASAVFPIRTPSCRCGKWVRSCRPRRCASMYMSVAADHEVLVDHGIVDAQRAALVQRLILEILDGVGKAHAQRQMAGGVLVEQRVVEQDAGLRDGAVARAPARTRPDRTRPRPWRSCS